MTTQAWCSAASRAYYAAYQAATAMLLYAGETPPNMKGWQGESWHHAAMPNMVYVNLRKLIRNGTLRASLSSGLAESYKRRVIADYAASRTMPRNRAEVSRRHADVMIKTAVKVIGT